MNNWISVKDRLPEESGVYLIYAINEYQNNKDVVTIAGYDCYDEYWYTYYIPLYWMPLPKPPEVEE